MMKKFVICLACITLVYSCPEIKTRSNWGGKSSKSIQYQTIPVPNVIIHHTASSTCNTFRTCAQKVANIQHYHMNDLRWNDIGYNFLIGNDGNIYEGVGWNKQGAHAIGYNDKSIGIAFIGNFDNVLPTTSALDAAKALIKCGVDDGYLSAKFKLYGARQVKATVSPGFMLYNEIQNWDNWTTKS